jgi:hypothetical protein
VVVVNGEDGEQGRLARTLFAALSSQHHFPRDTSIPKIALSRIRQHIFAMFSHMPKYHSLSELMWARVTLACRSVPLCEFADRETFDNLLAANRVEALHILSGVPVTDGETTWLAEKLTWNKYCKLASGAFFSRVTLQHITILSQPRQSRAATDLQTWQLDFLHLFLASTLAALSKAYTIRWQN